MNNEIFNNFQRKLKQYFNVPPFLFAKGRIGLYAVLKAMGLGHGDDVLMAGYTCLVVPTAAKVLGIRPVYVDIDPTTYNISPDNLESCCTSNTKAIVVQHTYGIPCDMDPILQWAETKNIPVFEDACLAFGAKYKGKLCGAFGQAAFFSGQWNKTFSTGLGGMLFVHDDNLSQKVQTIIEREMIQPKRLYDLMIRFQIFLYDNLVTPATTQTITSIYRFLSKSGFAIGSSTKGEYEGTPPSNYFMGMTPSQAHKGIKEMDKIDENLAHRNEISSYYHNALPQYGFSPVVLDTVYNPVFVRYPVRVKNKKDLLEQANKERVEIGSWFESPLHPESTNLESFDYNPSLFPESVKASKEVINLPTHGKITLKEAERVLAFLKKNGIPG